MRVYREMEKLPRRIPFFITIGNFLSLHSGHQHILDVLKSKARSRGAKSLLIMIVPSGKSFQGLLNSKEREQLLKRLDIDYVLYLRLEDIKDLTWHRFLEKLNACINLRGFAASYKIRIGKDRGGTPAQIRRWFHSKGISDVFLVTSLKSGRYIISTSLIKSFIQAGRVREAAQCLKRPYRLSGRVVSGRKIGRTMGFPTINIHPSRDKFVPGEGVYAVSVKIAGGSYGGVCFVGRPLSYSISVVEAHLLNFSKTVYNYKSEFFFLEFLRTKRKAGPDELKHLIKSDIQKARDLFQKPGV